MSKQQEPKRDNTTMKWGTRLITDRIERWLSALAFRSHQHPVTTLSAILVVTIITVAAAGKMPLNANLADLLPKSFKSVQDLEIVKKRFGGVGYMIVCGLDAEPDVLRRFADDLVPKLNALDTVRYVEYTRAVAFFEDRFLYFLETDDLKTIDERLSARMAWEQRSRNPLYLDLEDEEPPPLDFSDLQENYADRNDQTWMRSQMGEKYYIDTELRIIVIMAKPTSVSFDMAFAKKVSEDIVKIAEATDLSKYPGLRIGYTGQFFRRVEQQTLINKDLRTASILAFILTMLYLALHFRRLLAVALITVPLVAGLLWAYGFAAFKFGSLNILTGFNGAILLGLGVDHGIHLLARYESERTNGKSPDEAILKTFGSTGRAVTIAAITTAVGFAGLGLSDFRAFYEFGIIAAAGMLLVVFSYVVCMPALLSLASRYGWKPHRQTSAAESEHANRLPARARPIFFASAAILIVIITQVPTARFDYDFGALSGSELESYTLDQQVNRLLGYSQSPVVVLTKDLEDERKVAAALRVLQEKAGDESTIEFVVASADLVPLNQEEKVPYLESIHKVAMKIKAGQLDPEYRPYLKDLRRMTKTPPFGRDQLPESVQRQFRGLDGTTEYGFVLVFPSIDLMDGAAVWRFANEVRDVPMPDGRRVSAAGENMILADIFDMVSREAPVVMTITLVLIFLTLLILLGNLRHAILCLAPGLLTLFGTLGLMRLVDIDLNYLNIVMIPVLFGIAVDGGAHLVTRIADGQPLTEAIGETGRAISGANLTTGLGFGAMLVADHPGLESLGKLAVLGLAVNTLVTLVVLPAFLAWKPLVVAQPIAEKKAA